MIRLSTLGSVDIRAGDGTTLRALLPQSKRLALLVHLAVARRTGMHRRDRLLALFWPELDERRGRDALNQAVHVLRKALGPGAILSRGADEIGVDHELVWCDANAFQAALDEGKLEEALELYRGDLLESYFVEGSRGFEEWLTEERASLRAKAAQAARTLAERREASRDLTIAVDFARRALALSWLDERALRRLIELLERVGDRAAAVQAYEEFAKRLASELELVPSAETLALIERLRSGMVAPSPTSRNPAAQQWKIVPRPALADDGSAKDREPEPVSPVVVRDQVPTTTFTDDSGRGARHFVPGAPDIDGHVIEREIGSGGAAVVYLARELEHGRPVAIKVLKPEFAQSIQAERFLREIRIIASLSHPHILPLLTSGRSGEMLYYVMPYVSGESLRHRLKRERQLGIAETVRIAREVALALDHAHRHGVVHRDVKPANILLADGQAQVADFGISRAIGLADDARLTLLRAAVGTPAYMSPEQAAGEGEVDGRTDIYALGCVLYEMLSGAPPFGGVTPQQIFARHAAAAVPPLGIVRATVPRALEEIVEIALAKTAADRFASAGEMAEALDEIRVRRLRVSAMWRRVRRISGGGRRIRALRGVALAAVTLWAGGSGVPDAGADTKGAAEPSLALMTLDSLRFVVVPSDSGDRLSPIGETQLFRDALVHWTDVAVADAYRVREAFDRQARGVQDPDAASLVARELQAGAYFRVSASRVGGSVRLNGVMYDTRTTRPLSEASAHASTDPGSVDSAISVMVESLLFGGVVARERGGSTGPTRSVLARRAFKAGQAAIERWDLVTADAQFFDATRHDPQYAQSFLWLALVRNWAGDPAPRWRLSAETAERLRERLHASDRLAAGALVSEVRGNIGRACDLWRRMTLVDSTNFASWYSLGHCLRMDDAVRRDSRSPSGWAFRSSHHSAINAYQRAFQLLPGSHRSYRGGYFDDGRDLFFTGRAYVRNGRALPPDTARFAAYPEWQGDSLAHVPYRSQQFANNERVSSEAVSMAVLHQRRRFHETTTMWRAAAPHSAEALEAVAATLDLLGNSTALDSLELARRLAGPADDRLGILALEVWIRVKRAVPSDLASLRTAVRLADSVLAVHQPATPREAEILANLAALLGRAHLSAARARLGSLAGLPPSLVESAPTLVAYAALGGPVDSLRALERRVGVGMRTSLTTSERADVRHAWLLRAALLAAPYYAFETVSDSTSNSSLRESLLRAWRRGNLAEAREVADTLRERRQRAKLRASDLTLDILYMEAAVLATLGDTLAAFAWLAPTLDSLTLVAPRSIGEIARPGPLVRAMALRSELAKAIGDEIGARAWARAVLTLWHDPDEFLLPIVQRMQALGG